MIWNAHAVGVERIVAVGTDLSSSRRSIQIAEQYKGVKTAVGMHPLSSGNFDQESNELGRLLNQESVCAIGEIGLDYFRCPISHDVQQSAFRSQLAWAQETHLPVVVHDRNAHEDVIRGLREFRVPGVLHCFSGTVRLAEEAVSLDLFISLAGNVTYRKARNLHEVARWVPIERLLLETDSPYLSPDGWRGKRNEPARVTEVAARIAELRKCTPESVAQATSANAAGLFGWSLEGD